jgi:hypothetical protein
MNIDIKKITGPTTGDPFMILESKHQTEVAFIDALYIINSFIKYPDCYEENKERGLKLINKYEHEKETTPASESV